jgi:hypothetical protein
LFGQQPQNSSVGVSVLVTDAQQRPVAGAVCSISLAKANSPVAATASTDQQGMAKFPACDSAKPILPTCGANVFRFT